MKAIITILFLSVITASAQNKSDIDAVNELLRRYENAYEKDKTVIKEKFLYTAFNLSHASVTSLKDISDVYLKKSTISGRPYYNIYIKSKWKRGTLWGMENKKGDFKFGGNDYKYTDDVDDEMSLNIFDTSEDIVAGLVELFKKIAGLKYGDYLAATNALKTEVLKPESKPILSKEILIGTWKLAGGDMGFGFIPVDSLANMGDFEMIEFGFYKKDNFEMKVGESVLKGKYQINASLGSVTLTESGGEAKIELIYSKKDEIKLVEKDEMGAEMAMIFKKKD